MKNQNLKLAEYPDGVVCDSDDYDQSTTSLLRYGRRDGCTDAEYNIAERMQSLRVIALELVNQLFEEGLDDIPERYLKTIEVTRDTITEEIVSL